MNEALAALVALALHEDLEHGGDATSEAVVGEGQHAKAQIVARRPGVLAGTDAVEVVLDAVEPELASTLLRADGDHLHAGAPVVEIAGPARGLLAAERTVLNLLGHLSGVATLTAGYVEAVAGTGCLVRDTRKTLPGLRTLEKRAVAAGGGVNHRIGLFDGVLVKDNHVALAGGVAAATRRALAWVEQTGRPLEVQVEVDDLGELDAALEAGARTVLLDNFALGELRAAVTRCRREPWPIFVEASGGLALETVRAVAETGVDAVAVGALTHSAPALDLGLDLDVLA